MKPPKKRLASQLGASRAHGRKRREPLSSSNRMTLLQITVTALLALITASLTFAQVQTTRANSRLDQENKRFEIMERLSQKCMSKDQADREQALQVAAFFSKQGNGQAWKDPNTVPSNAAIQTEKARMQWARIFNRDPEPEVDLSFDNINKTCAAWVFKIGAKVAEPNTSATKPTAPAEPEKPGQVHWVYLGTYKDSRWETWYLDQLPKYDPSQFVTPQAAQALPVMTVREQTGALNLRVGDFSDSGAFPAVSSSLQPKAKVRILNTWQWFNSGNWWAKIMLEKTIYNNVPANQTQALRKQLIEAGATNVDLQVNANGTYTVTATMPG